MSPRRMDSTYAPAAPDAAPSSPAPDAVPPSVGPSVPCTTERGKRRQKLKASSYAEPPPEETDIIQPDTKEEVYRGKVTVRGHHRCCGEWGATAHSWMMPVRGVAGAAGAGPGAAEEAEAWRWTFFHSVTKAVEYTEAHWDRCRGDMVCRLNKRTAEGDERSKKKLAKKKEDPEKAAEKARAKSKRPNARQADNRWHTKKRREAREEQMARLKELGFDVGHLRSCNAAARKDPEELDSEVKAILLHPCHCLASRRSGIWTQPELGSSRSLAWTSTL